TKAAMADLRPGDVVILPGSRRRGLAVITANRDGKPTVFTEDRRFFRASPSDFDGAPRPVARVDLPRSGSTRSARFRRDLASALVALRVDRRTGHGRLPPSGPVDREALAKAAELERRATQHPCHTCPDLRQHERWAE